MRFPAIAIVLLAGVVESNVPRSGRDLKTYVASERARSLQGILDNIGPDGAKVAGASSGIVVASPSTVNPDCKFHLISKAFTVC